jgi:hypothetical protein
VKDSSEALAIVQGRQGRSGFSNTKSGAREPFDIV